MIRVVFDTNIIVSAALTRDGAEAYVLDLATARHVQLYLTEIIFAEYQEVLQRPKFGHLDAEVVPNLLAVMRRISIFVEPRRILSFSPDESDNRFFERADIAQAHYLVTGNRKLFPAGLEDTEVVNARELIEIVTNQLRDE
jgi:putative PIN family toxin of toxin-antitoxin system